MDNQSRWGQVSPLDEMSESEKREAIRKCNLLCEGLPGWRYNNILKDHLSRPENRGVRDLLLTMIPKNREAILVQMQEGALQPSDVPTEGHTRRTRRVRDVQEPVLAPVTHTELRPPVNAPEKNVIDPTQRTLDEWTYVPDMGSPMGPPFVKAPV